MSRDHERFRQEGSGGGSIMSTDGEKIETDLEKSGSNR